MSFTPDVSSVLRPEFVIVVDKIYRDLCNLQPGTKVLIISDSRTPQHVVNLFMGMAMAMGAEVCATQNYLAPPPADQPAYSWNPMIVAAAREAELIVDMAVGYADFMAEAIERGAQIITPGDGTGGMHLEETLIRTMLGVDLNKMRREAIHIADQFSAARELRITSEEGTDFTADITGLEGIHSHEYLWDPDRKQKVYTWSALPPAAPGIVLPKGAGNGVLAVDGLLMLADANRIPKSTVYLTLKKGKIVGAEGEDRPLVAQMNRWLDTIDGDTGRYGPVHINLGLNPKARLNEHQEFEKIRGTIVLGFGDSRFLTRMFSGSGLETVDSPVHWDVIVMRPTIRLDGMAICTAGQVPAYDR